MRPVPRRTLAVTVVVRKAPPLLTETNVLEGTRAWAAIRRPAPAAAGGQKRRKRAREPVVITGLTC